MLATASDTALAADWLLRHNPSRALFKAARARRGDVMLHLLQVKGVSATAASLPFTSEPGGSKPLVLSAQLKLNHVLEYLWQRSDVRDDVGGAVAAVHAAAKSGNTGGLRLLLKEPSPVDVDNMNSYRGRSPLHLTALCIRGEAVQVLLQHGASCTFIDDKGFAALHFSCGGTERGSTTEEEAHARAAVVRMLLDAPQGRSVIDRRASAPEFAVHQNAGPTPLQCAAMHGLVGACEELLRSGAQVDLPGGYYGETPYQQALPPIGIVSNKVQQVRKVLLRYGARKKRSARRDFSAAW